MKVWDRVFTPYIPRRWSLFPIEKVLDSNFTFTGIGFAVHHKDLEKPINSMFINNLIQGRLRFTSSVGLSLTYGLDLHPLSLSQEKKIADKNINFISAIHGEGHTLLDVRVRSKYSLDMTQMILVKTLLEEVYQSGIQHVDENEYPREYYRCRDRLLSLGYQLVDQGHILQDYKPYFTVERSGITIEFMQPNSIHRVEVKCPIPKISTLFNKELGLV